MSSVAGLLVPNEMELHAKVMTLSGVKSVATPSNANAAAALVPVGGIYRSAADPAILYIRTV